MNRSIWKPNYVNYFLINKILKNKKRVAIRTKSRSSTILQSFIGMTFFVYTGNKYIRLTIIRKMVGYKFGEFSFTRKFGKIHEKKFGNLRGTLKKSKKKSNVPTKTVPKKINEKRKTANKR